MASAALHSSVSSGEREFCPRIVIEIRARPLSRVVANRTVLGKTRRWVIRVFGAIKIGLVAGHAGRVERGELIVCMARLTSDRYMRPGQHKLGLVVIEFSSRPLCGCMTGLAVLGEACRDVVRIFRTVPIRQMAGDARACQAGVNVVFMAHVAHHGHMRARQRILGRGIMVESRVGPGGRAVADRAILREAGRKVVRILCSVEIGLMAGETAGRQAGEHVVFVAAGARHRYVCAVQGEFGTCRMIEFGSRPLIRVVTEGAVQREARSDVVRVRRAVELLRVARLARG